MRRQARRVGFGVAAVAAAALLFSVSVPGIDLVVGFVASITLAGLAVVWLIDAVSFARSARRRQECSGAWFLAAPIGAAVVAGMIAANIPLQFRWQLSRPAFEAAAHAASVADAAAVPPRRIDCAPHLGSYGIRLAERVGDNVVFWDTTGDFVNDAGFAYLPHGPAALREFDVLEHPRLVGLGGGWYAWTASW